MKTFTALLSLCLLTLLSGCGTPGNLSDDRSALEERLSQLKRLPAMCVVFEELPGKTGDSLTIGPGLSGSHSVNADKIAYQEAQNIFSLACESVEVLVPGLDDADTAADGVNVLTLRLKADASTSAFDGSHVAKIDAVLISAQGRVLLETHEEVNVKDSWQYAQTDTMQRAFIAAYGLLIEKISALPSLE
jgi:hypothetical protein